MTYYNYHGIVKKLISNGRCTHAEFKANYNKINPVLILYFDNHKPMPIREKHFSEYINILRFFEIKIINIPPDLDS